MPVTCGCCELYSCRDTWAALALHVVKPDAEVSAGAAVNTRARHFRVRPNALDLVLTMLTRVGVSTVALVTA